ncbi:MAG: hypothetical protein ABSH39_07815 [Candidatus Acidiferrum sp.]
MSTTPMTTTSSPDTLLHAAQAILTAGAICGTLDGLSALAISKGHFVRLFQFIASGILGPDAFKGGMKIALLGLSLHFLIALTASAVFYTASRFVPFLIDHAIISGALFGILVHLFMNLAVIPMSAIGRRPFNPTSFTMQLLIHIVVVGQSIALIVRYFSRG